MCARVFWAVHVLMPSTAAFGESVPRLAVHKLPGTLHLLWLLRRLLALLWPWWLLTARSIMAILVTIVTRHLTHVWRWMLFLGASLLFVLAVLGQMALLLAIVARGRLFRRGIFPLRAILGLTPSLLENTAVRHTGHTGQATGQRSRQHYSQLLKPRTHQ